MNFARLFFATVLLVACTRQTASSVDTVSVPHTSARAQGPGGFCWAYAFIALAESQAMKFHSLFKAQTPGMPLDSKANSLNLSESALIFYHITDAVELALRAPSRAETERLLSREFLENWYVMSRGSNALPDAFEISAQHGLLPRSVYSYPLDQPGAIFAAIKDRALALRGPWTRDTLMNQVVAGPEGFATVPPVSFSWEGATTSALEYAAKIGWNPRAFELTEVFGEENLGPFVQRIKQTLASGTAVPMRLPETAADIQGNRFQGDLAPGVSMGVDGAHYVALVDFVNVGGSRGALSPLDITAAVAAPWTKLDALVFKNSWGMGPVILNNGKSISGSPDGEYEVDLAYLRRSAQESTTVSLLSAVVPKAP